MSQVSQPGARGFLLHIQTLFPPGTVQGAGMAAGGSHGCQGLGWVLEAPMGAGPARPRCPKPEVPSIPGGAGLCPSLICLQ